MAIIFHVLIYAASSSSSLSPEIFTLLLQTPGFISVTFKYTYAKCLVHNFKHFSSVGLVFWLFGT